MPQPDDPMDIFKRLSESYRQIRFGRGVVGKTSHATITILGVWAIVLFRLSENLWFDVALIGVGIAATFVYLWWVRRTQAFATANPGLALLEGAEFVEYQKWEAQIKGQQPLPHAPSVPDPHARLPSPGRKSGDI